MPKPIVEVELDKAIFQKAKPYKKLSTALKLLEEDKYISGLLNQANKVAILRLGYNDHGPMHARITAYNGLKILELLADGRRPPIVDTDKSGAGSSFKFPPLAPTVVSEEIGDFEDSMVAILMGGYLHDCGISIVREGHELSGAIISRDPINQILRKIYKDDFKVARMASIVSECILCHMGTYKATSLEARIVEAADGTDASKGRARVPFHIGKADIHKFSALAIERVNIIKGEKKPVRLEVIMDNPAGVFQTEAIMKKKIVDAELENYIEIIASIKNAKPLVIL